MRHKFISAIRKLRKDQETKEKHIKNIDKEHNKVITTNFMIISHLKLTKN